MWGDGSGEGVEEDGSDFGGGGGVWLDVIEELKCLGKYTKKIISGGRASVQGGGGGGGGRVGKGGFELGVKVDVNEELKYL